MPPKASTRRSALKEDKKDDVPVQPEPEVKTRPTRGKAADKSAPKDVEPAKKVKPDEVAEDKAKSAPKRTRSGDLSASKKEDPPTKTSPAKIVAKEAAKPVAQQDLKKVVLKGTVPVDQCFGQASTFKVYSQGGITFGKTLNQSDIMNNNNKFYILQILQNQTNPDRFIFYTRWGRVGVEGQKAEIPCFSSAVAIREFGKKLRDKLNGGYREVEMNYESTDKKEEEKQKAKTTTTTKGEDQPEVQSNLDKSVQDLVRLIFDMKMMNNQMKQIGYDAQKMPLGKLAKNSILRGYEALKGLMDQVKGKKRHDVISKLSGDFYSEIPHNFGFQKMQNFILDTQLKVKQKLEMLQSLQDIQVFTKLLDQGKISSDMNELDSNYLKLNTNITPLDKNSDTYKLLVEYVDNTHASSHTAYKLEVQEIFELSKDLENNRYRKDITNKQLLWHGSRLTNFVGILSQGLRIAPPQAPVTGYMFGKGVYFADMVTKSANYCFTNPTNNTGLMLLCQVALGDVNEKYYADYYANLLPPGKFSTKGCGKNAPGSGKYLGQVYVPCGVGTNTNIPAGSLMYNEFIVYDIAQIKSKYLFRMRFNYNYKR